MDSPKARLKILQSEYNQFKHYLEGLPPDAWSRPSACDRWRVADVVAHLSSRAFAVRISRGLEGDSSPPEGSPPVSAHDEDAFAERIAHSALSLRESLGNDLLRTFIANGDELNQIFAGLSPEDWDKLCYWPPGPEPIRTLLDVRISELTMHEWDIRSKLDPQYSLTDDAARVLIDTVPRAVRRAFRADATLSTPIRYRFIVAGPIPTSSDIAMSRDGTRIEPSGISKTDVTFQCDAETYVLVMYGRLTPEAAIADRRLSFEGDERLAAEFGRRFKGG